MATVVDIALPAILPIGLEDMATGVPGNLISYDPAGDAVAVATGTAAQVLTSNGAGLAPTFQAPAGGAAAITAVSVVAPYGGYEASIVVVDAGIAPTSKIMLSWGAALDTDENGPDMDDIAMSARPAAGSMTVRLAMVVPSAPALGGSYKLNYQVGA